MRENNERKEPPEYLYIYSNISGVFLRGVCKVKLRVFSNNEDDHDDIIKCTGSRVENNSTRIEQQILLKTDNNKNNEKVYIYIYIYLRAISEIS